MVLDMRRIDEIVIMIILLAGFGVIGWAIPFLLYYINYNTM